MKKNFRKWPALFLAVCSLVVSGFPAAAETKAADAYTVKVESGYLALRSAPAYDAANEIEELYTGDNFYVMSEYNSTYVYGYSESGKEGYVNKNYLVEAYFPAAAETKAADAYTVKVKSGYLALRSAPAYDAANEIEELYTGDNFYVMSEYNSTYVYGYSESGKEGYVNKNYLVEAYNIASGIKTRASGGSSFLETDHFSLCLPGDISWEYEAVDNVTVSIYYPPARKAGYGGHVVTIKAYDWGDNEYGELPAWSMAGADNEKKYIAVFPTDVQFDPDDSVQASEYGRLLKVVQRMDCEDEELAKDNPFDVTE